MPSHLRSSIPKRHPERQDIEDAIRHVLTAVQGDWVVEIHAPEWEAWWTLRVIEWRSQREIAIAILHGDQTPPGVERLLIHALMECSDDSSSRRAWPRSYALLIVGRGSRAEGHGA